MLISEGLKLLETAPTDNKMSRINKNLTRAQVVNIIEKGLKSVFEKKGDIDISKYENGIFEKRVWQCVKNQRRPKY